MRKIYFLLILVTSFLFCRVYGQAILPDFTIKNTNGNISVFWLNQYPIRVNGISVQRSFDSSKNFTSVASVFNPQNTVNGFTDVNPPYNKMYYRLFIGFDTGIYILTEAKKPELYTVIDYSKLIIEINALYEKNISLHQERLKAQREAAPALDAKKAAVKKSKTVRPGGAARVAEVDKAIINEVITYPSKHIFTDNEDNIVINLPSIKSNNYVIKFYTEDYKPLFILKNVTEDHLVIEKVNFSHAGWFIFEIFKNDLLFEENKFYIPKDDKK